MTDNYDHLRTPSTYDDMIRPLLEAKEAVERNIQAVYGTAEARVLHYALAGMKDIIGWVTSAHRWDGDEPRT